MTKQIGPRYCGTSSSVGKATFLLSSYHPFSFVIFLGSTMGSKADCAATNFIAQHEEVLLRSSVV
jgi:hypothetical protein